MLLNAPLEAQESARRNPYTSPADVAMGKRRYRPLCSNCHGQDGKGVIGLAPGLVGALQHASSDGKIFDTLITGIAGTSMPAFSLTERQAWELVSFVRSIGGRAGDSVDGDAAAGESLFPGAMVCGRRVHILGVFGNRNVPCIARGELQSFLDERAGRGLSFSVVDHLLGNRLKIKILASNRSWGNP